MLSSPADINDARHWLYKLPYLPRIEYSTASGNAVRFDMMHHVVHVRFLSLDFTSVSIAISRKSTNQLQVAERPLRSMIE